MTLLKTAEPARLDPDKLGARAEAMIQELAHISAEPDRLVRLFLTPEHRRAADLVASWMSGIGLDVSEDALGTVRGRLSGRSGGSNAPRRLLVGSHIDSVIDAGNYDGPLGVIAGIVAAEHFARSGDTLPFDLDVLAFGDEEGSRFPFSRSGSGACTGHFDPELLAFRDRDGVSYADALSAYGKNRGEIAHAAYRPEEVAAFVELHIEQGPALEAANEPLGVVTGICGQSRLRVTVTGVAGHAGTVPMTMRNDALLGAAEMALAAEAVANANRASAMVATVGRIDAAPGATNIIPGRADFTVDLRDMDDGLRYAALARLEDQCREIAARRGLSVAFESVHDVPAVACAPALQDGLGAAVSALGHAPLRLASGAGHDAQTMAALCPSAMLFVRCRGGVSHNPAEYASPADMGVAIAALIRFIERFDPEAIR